MRLHPLLFASALVACAAGDGTDDLGDQLDQPQRASFAPNESKTSLHATLRDTDGIHGGEASVLVRDGHIMVQVVRGPDHDDRLVIDELRLAYQDVVLPPAYFHDGQVLTDIVGRLEQPLTLHARWTGDGAAWASGTTDIRLDWKLRVDGEVVPLGSQTLPALDVEVVVSREAGALRVDVALFHSGVMWTWLGDVITLGELELIATAYRGID